MADAAFADLKPEIIASSAVRERIEKEGGMWVERFAAMTQGATGGSRIVKPTQVYDAPVAIDFGGLKAELIPSGNAHSPGDLIVWLPAEKLLFGGDVLYVERAPATFDARIEPWIAILGDLEARGPKRVIPGHGPVADGAAVARLRSYLEDLWRVVAEGYEAGQPDFEIVPRAREVMAETQARFPRPRHPARRVGVARVFAGGSRGFPVALFHGAVVSEQAW
ncbi:MAG: MBL fold metallo-hydrolase [Chromatiales bacterium]|nr:MBL fold metallo-hydrolase [Chromatiales bacterium]